MIEQPFSQLDYDLDTDSYRANAPTQQLLGIGAEGDGKTLASLMGLTQWQQLQQGAKTKQALFIPIPKSGYLWLGTATNNLLIWIITPQSHWQRQIEQWQHNARLASVGQVMAGICHEVNQPLNAMRLRLYGLAELAATGAINDLGQHLQELDNQIDRCASTLLNMRQLVGHQPINHRQFDLAQSLKQIHKLLASQLQQQRIELRLQEPLPTSLLFGQAQRFEQVLINLINNARDAILEHSNQGLIQLELKHQSQEYHVQVTDNGPGIPANLQEQVFAPYYTSKRHQGTGLGLALCRDLVTELQGQLQLQSEPDHTCFTIIIPQSLD
ncbi:MAG: HAMP domain-containing histidine kinase [Gammaproteobacteria bacterium]|nr:HAMP domain-containing histidine kinase [Gammaproteobacteria bacterium]MCP4881349.1 HAMP domain-containing histidine kinase [Gammaproteobacteria bacterium]